MSSNVMLWISENLNRLFLKSPKFFRIWKIIGYILFIISGVPQILSWMQVQMGIDIWAMLPEFYQNLGNKIILGASAVMIFMSTLTVNTTDPDSGENKSLSDSLPYTRKKPTAKKL